MKLNELSRMDPDEAVDTAEYWALYHNFYQLFIKISSRNKLLAKYKKMMKILKPGRGRAALTFFYRIRRDEIDEQLDLNKPNVRMRLVKESLSFKRGANPHERLGLGKFRHPRHETLSWKILEFIEESKEVGRSLKEIQLWLWLKNGNDEKTFYSVLPKAYYSHIDPIEYKGKGRASRGYYNTLLLGGRYPTNNASNRKYKLGLLKAWCKKNENGKWIIDKMPEPHENLTQN